MKKNQSQYSLKIKNYIKQYKMSLSLSIIFLLSFSSYLYLIFNQPKTFSYIKYDRKKAQPFIIKDFKFLDNKVELVLFNGLNIKIVTQPSCLPSIQSNHLDKMKNEKINLALSQVTVFNPIEYTQEIQFDPINDYICELDKTLKKINKT